MNKVQNNFQTNQQKEQLPTKIFFSSQIFGKPTKNRTQDPSMFDLLKWNNQGIQVANFKKRENFKNTQQAYLNMISKEPWKSETQQSYINYSQNSIQINSNIFSEIQNYVEAHQSKNNKPLMKKSKAEQKVATKQKTQKQVLNNQLKKLEEKQRNNQMQKSSEQKIKEKSIIKNQHQKKNLIRSNSVKNMVGINQQIVPYSNFVENDTQEKNWKKKDQITEQEQIKLIQQFKQTTRWIPNSSFTTYFGRPPFQNYGRANTKPVDGGLIYGTYLYSHNVHPHRGSNTPKKIQTYPVALMKAKSQGNLIPTQPKTVCNYLQNKINNQKQKLYDNHGSIEATQNVYGSLNIDIPDLRGVEKFGGRSKQIKRISTISKMNN